MCCVIEIYISIFLHPCFALKNGHIFCANITKLIVFFLHFEERYFSIFFYFFEAFQKNFDFSAKKIHIFHKYNHFCYFLPFLDF